MSEPNDLLELPDDVRVVLARGREGVAVPEDVRARLHARVRASIAAAAPAAVASTTAPTVANSAGLAKITTVVGVITFATGVGVGIGAHAFLTEPRVVVREHRVEVPVIREVIAHEPSRLGPPPPAATPASARAASSPSMPSPPATLGHPRAAGPTGSTPPPVVAPPMAAAGSGAVSDREAERTLLRQANAALARANANDALGAIAEHAQRFPASDLTEEREALAIRALAMSERHDEARARADAFFRRYPSSIFRAPVERALAAPP